MHIDRTDSHTRYVNILRAFITAKKESGDEAPDIDFGGRMSLDTLLKDVIEYEESLSTDEYIPVEIGRSDARIYNTEGFPLQLFLNRGYISYHEDFYKHVIQHMASPLVIEDREGITLRN